MSKPLTEEQKARAGQLFEADVDRALARLDYLERKVQAAERLADAVRTIAPLVTVDYDEVTE